MQPGVTAPLFDAGLDRSRRCGIPEYVILDVVHRRVEIRRRPEGEDWGETLVLTESGECTPSGASAPIRFADLSGDPEQDRQ